MVLLRKSAPQKTNLQAAAELIVNYGKNQVKIGSRDVLFNEFFIAFPNEEVEFFVQIGSLGVTFKITFIEDESKDPISWEGNGNVLKMTFSNWGKKGGLLNTLFKPFKLGNADGKKFGFNFSCSKSADSYHVHFMVMHGGEYDE